MSRTPPLSMLLGLPSSTPDDACLRFVKAYGGRRLYVPRTLHPEHRLCELLGSGPAAQLVAARGGEYLSIPLLSRYKRAQTAAIVASAQENGWSQETIANRFRISRRQVQRLLALAREREQQP